MNDGLLIANALATWFMVGVIWLVQLLIYPSFRNIAPERFLAEMLKHQTVTGRVVILPMLVELGTSLALLVFNPELVLLWLGNVCVGVWGFSTVLVQVPQHTRLAAEGPDARTLANLVKYNWPRTIAWTLHGGICAVMLSK